MHPYAKHSQMAVGHRRANKLIHGNEYARGGRAKKHGDVNIAIVQPHRQPPPAIGAPPIAPGGPPMPPPGMGAGLPPGGPPMPPPGMMRKRGGRTYAKGGKVHMTAGAESGVGRLEKAHKRRP